MRYLILLLLFAGISKIAWDYTQSIKNQMGETVSTQSSVNTTISSLSEFEKQGKNIFDENCASCHGKNAIGVEGAGPSFINKIYEPSHHADITFLRAAQYGVRAHHWPYGNMPKQPQVNTQDITKIVAYIRKLQKDNGVFK